MDFYFYLEDIFTAKSCSTERTGQTPLICETEPSEL